jgi:hypothetical protein
MFGSKNAADDGYPAPGSLDHRQVETACRGGYGWNLKKTRGREATIKKGVLASLPQPL